MHRSFLRVFFSILISWISLACGEFNGESDPMWNRISQLFHRSRTPVGLLDEDAIPEVAVEYRGEIGLELQGAIELAFDEATPGIGEIARLVFTPDQSFIFSDGISGEVHEFSLEDGRYIRSFGRRGRGPGEYGAASDVWISPDNHVYVSDTSSGRILCYDRQGTYLNNITMNALVMWGSRNGDLLIVVDHWPNKIVFFQKINPKNGQIKYSVGLSAREYDLTVHNQVWLPYHSTLNRAYHAGAMEYMIKEVDVAKGKILRRFGWKPPDFIPLAEKYYTEFNSIDELDEAISSSSILERMALVDEHYLIVSYINPQGVKDFGIVYDLTATDIIPAYSLDDAAIELVLWESTTFGAYQDRLHLYKTPSAERGETSNGRLEHYALSLP